MRRDEGDGGGVCDGERRLMEAVKLGCSDELSETASADSSPKKWARARAPMPKNTKPRSYYGRGYVGCGAMLLSILISRRAELPSRHELNVYLAEKESRAPHFRDGISLKLTAKPRAGKRSTTGA
jgi:hypothetical protein